MLTQSRPSPTTTREQAQEKYEAKLELVREQVASGSLVIRQMTERSAANTPTPRPLSTAAAAVIDGRT